MADIRPGQRLTANLLKSMTPQAPQPWDVQRTTSSGSNLPAFGNSTVISEYTAYGRRCSGRLEINFGSTVSFGGGGGSDNWRFSAPVSAFGAAQIVGFGEIWEDSVGLGKRQGCRLRMTTPDVFELEISTGLVDGTASGGVGIVDAVTPWTRAIGDNLYFDFQYPTAA